MIIGVYSSSQFRAVDPVAAVFYEPFEGYAAGSLVGQTGTGKGTSGVWLDPTGGGVLHGDSAGLTFSSLKTKSSSGCRFTTEPTSDGTDYVTAIALDAATEEVINPTNVGETVTFYFSFLFRGDVTASDPNTNLNGMCALAFGHPIGPPDVANQEYARMQWRMLEPNAKYALVNEAAGFVTNQGAGSANNVMKDKRTYLFICKAVVEKFADRWEWKGYMSRFKEGDGVPTSEPSWDISRTATDMDQPLYNMTRICFWSEYGDDSFKVDELRISDTFADVVPQSVVVPQPYMHYEFDEGSGITVNDTRGINNGTITGTVTWPISKINYGLNIDANNEYVDTNSTINLTAASNWSAMAWVKLDTAPTTATRKIMQQVDGTGTGRTWLGISPGSELTTYLGGAGATSVETLSVGVWYHVAIVANGSGIKLYLNGAEVATHGSTIEANDAVFRIGNNKTTPTIDDAFLGTIDDFYLYNEALTQAQVSTVMGFAP